jgi:BirA family biotin operon repressor/biotin-[acetyl-CoA-carboxylase] ligase
MALIDLVLLKSRLGEYSGRFDVDALDECDSTSSELARRAERGAPGGSVIVADRQTAGRGRRGRIWLSGPADSLTFSLLWRFEGSPARLSGLSLAVGVALARGLKKMGVRGAGLKWPNDVLLRVGDIQGKLAGILVELSSDRRGTQAIIGIGINLRPPAGELPQPVAGLSQASSLPDRHELLAVMLAELADAMMLFGERGFAAFQAEWDDSNVWRGQAIQILAEGQAPLLGTCLGADADGALFLRTATGTERVFSGDVSLRPA